MTAADNAAEQYLTPSDGDADNADERYLVEPPYRIGWHSLFWAEGAAFKDQGYADTNTVTTWPNETGESDLANTNNVKPIFTASETDLASQPAVSFNGSTHDLYSDAFTSNPSYTSGVSIVMILDLDLINGYYCDGIAENNRNILSDSTGWRIFGGDSFVGNTVPASTGAHLVRGFFDGSTGDEIMWADEVQVASGNGGSDTLTGLTLGGGWAGNGSRTNFQCALVGIYEGDISAHENWAEFKLWVTAHYGIALA